MASLTLSAGLPSTIQPSVEPSSSSTCLTTRGFSSVIECPTPLCSTAGAMTVTSPSRINSLRKARSPGAKTPSSLVSKICTSEIPKGPLPGESEPPERFGHEPTERDRNGTSRSPSTARRPLIHFSKIQAPAANPVPVVPRGIPPNDQGDVTDSRGYLVEWLRRPCPTPTPALPHEGEGPGWGSGVRQRRRHHQSPPMSRRDLVFPWAGGRGPSGRESAHRDRTGRGRAIFRP